MAERIPGGSARRLPGPLAAGVTGALLMAGTLLYAAQNGDIARDWAAIARNPWGLATLAEVYVGLALFCGWILHREHRVGRAWVWIVLVVSLGNIVACVYLIHAAVEAGGSRARFWGGDRGSRDATSPGARPR